MSCRNTNASSGSTAEIGWTIYTARDTMISRRISPSSAPSIDSLQTSKSTLTTTGLRRPWEARLPNTCCRLSQFSINTTICSSTSSLTWTSSWEVIISCPVTTLDLINMLIFLSSLSLQVNIVFDLNGPSAEYAIRLQPAPELAQRAVLHLHRHQPRPQRDQALPGVSRPQRA